MIVDCLQNVKSSSRSNVLFDFEDEIQHNQHCYYLAPSVSSGRHRFITLCWPTSSMCSGTSSLKQDGLLLHRKRRAYVQPLDMQYQIPISVALLSCFKTCFTPPHASMNTVTNWVPQSMFLTCTIAYIVHQLVFHIMHMFYTCSSLSVPVFVAVDVFN